MTSALRALSLVEMAGPGSKFASHYACGTHVVRASPPLGANGASKGQSAETFPGLLNSDSGTRPTAREKPVGTAEGRHSCRAGRLPRWGNIWAATSFLSQVGRAAQTSSSVAMQIAWFFFPLVFIFELLRLGPLQDGCLDGKIGGGPSSFFG